MNDRSEDERALHAYDRYFRPAVVAAALVHAIIIGSVVPPRGGDYEARADELTVIDLPPEIRIPPPPEEIARPAVPVIAAEPENVRDDITIAETDIVANQEIPPVEAPPGLTVEPAVGERYSFTPYTVRPRCESGCSSANVLAYVPALLKRAGVQCTLTVGIRIDTSGNVTATDMITSSGNPGCDQAAEEWARTTKWTVAMNRDVPVVVWLAQPLELRTE